MGLVDGISARSPIWPNPLATVSCHQVSAENIPLLLRSTARVVRAVTFSVPRVAVASQAVLPWLPCDPCPHQGLARTPAQGSGMLCSRGMGMRTAPVLVGACNGGRVAQAGGSSPLRHNPSASTVGSPWLATPQVPMVVWILAGALVTPCGSKFPAQQLPGWLGVGPSA